MKIVERSVVGLFTIIALGAALAAVDRVFESNNWKPMGAADWAAWMGAFGTIAAFIGTIWIATGERRVRERKEHDLAMITAASLMFRIIYVRRAINELELALEQRLENSVRVDYGAHYTKIEELDIWTNEELIPLVTLPNHAAAKLAAAQTMLKQVINTLEVRMNAIQIGPGREDVLRTQTAFVRTALRDGMNECTNISGKINLSDPALDGLIAIQRSGHRP